MNGNMVEHFKRALQQTEAEREPAHIAQLFAEGSALSNLGGDQTRDATEFWRVYLEQFTEIRSEFINEITAEGGAALEWKSRGRTKAGKPIDYRGVSLIEFDGEKLTGFRTYYDSAAFVRGL